MYEFSQTTFFLVLAAAFGFSFGSFGSMLIHRLPTGDTMLGRSKCPSCKNTLLWYDLVPLISFLFLRAQCRGCRKKISWRYPFLEAVTALTFVLLALRIQRDEGIALLFLLIASYVLILIAFYDFETQKIPDVFIAILMISALLYQAIISAHGMPHALQDAFVGAAIPFCFFGALWSVSGGRWIGSGDVLLGTSIGLLLGWTHTILTLFFAYVFGALFAIGLILLRLLHTESTMAFGPFLSGAALLALFVGDIVLRYYFMPWI